jgi:hypothetical protein
VHPFSDRGRFGWLETDAAFPIEDRYFGRKRLEVVEHLDGLQLHFAWWSQPLGNYMLAL